ncbi:MAG TPA: hypothetical protein VLE72_04185 [Candidatus Saccharimonadales bacterium]|nr:hypothetical protein [Candidatus Saccharimonadales bacterium]
MKLWNKFLVVRRDGTVPDWPYLVLGARDPATPVAIRALAAESRLLGMDPEYCDDLLGLADDFGQYRQEHGDGDPDAGPHRPDDPAVVSRFKRGTDRRSIREFGQPPD